MPTRPAARARLACRLLLCLAAYPAATAHAQKGRVEGVVRDSTGHALANVDVAIVSLRLLTHTNDSGQFVFNKLRAGVLDISARRLGYSPKTAPLPITELGVDTMTIVLSAIPAVLEEIEVNSSQYRKREFIEDFYRRRARGVGTYITRDQIEARNSFVTSDMFRTVPGIRFIRVPSGRGIRFNNTSIQRRDCPPMIWIDGQRAPGMELDDLPLTDIEGIEIYNGPSTTPLQFSQSLSQQTCGTIVIWSRPPPTGRRKG